MISYESRVVIERPAHDVFEALVDPTRYPLWTEMTDVRFDDDTPRAGSRGEFRLAAGPIKGVLRMEILELDPDRRVVIQVEHPWLSWRAVSELEPDGAATGTRLRYAGKMQLRGWRRLLEPLMAREVRAGEASEVLRLKALLEGTTAHGPERTS